MLERENGVYRNTTDTDVFLDRAKPSYIGGIPEMFNVPADLTDILDQSDRDYWMGAC
jgi:hypothetical protein